MKISKFKAETNLDTDLVGAVINQIGGKSSFKEYAEDIVNHGISGGFSGFTYYTDTVKFAQDNKRKIMELAEEMADQLGSTGALELIASFNCLNGDYSQTDIAEAIYSDSDDSEQVLNALAWFAGEEVARSYMDCMECAA
tara:strand:- start:10472 stop:10891 length:420 start_codon:yes stop_codon:yes gene_type:complete